MHDHLTEAVARRALAGELTADEQSAVDAHLLAACADRRCEQLLARLADETAGAGTWSPAAGRPAGEPVAVPGYQVLRTLGRGGMGDVYLARQCSLDRLVALKLILAGLHAGPRDRARFRAEAESIARMQHPNVVQIFEVGESSGQPFLALEYCAGGSLEARLGDEPMAPAAAARLVETLARAVHVLHETGIVHRDIKPANVLLAADGTPKLTDFGLAKVLSAANGPTVEGDVLGTPGYMAPEQAGGRSHTAGRAADVYALGATLYALLTGRPPFAAATPRDTVLQVLSQRPVPPRQLRPQVPCALEAICLKCLEKDPGRRYATAAALADDLRRFADGRPAAGDATRRRRAALLAGAAGLAAVAALAALVWPGAPTAPPPAQTAQERRTAGAKFAVLVGVRQYRLGGGDTNLSFTQSDVTELAFTLEARQGFRHENIQLLTQWAAADNPALAPTGANIRDRLRRTLTQCIPADSVVVMLTGLGGESGAPPTYYYLPADARLDDAESLMPLAEFYRLFAGCQARSKLLLVDTCQTVASGHAWPPAAEPPPGLAVYFACSPGEASYESARLRHGVFSYHLIQAFSGDADTDADGAVSLAELVRFTDSGVRDFLTSEMPGRFQTPRLLGTTPLP